MGKTRDFFKKIRGTMRTFHAKLGTTKDLTEAQDSKKRWREYTEKLYKKDLNDADNHDGVITYLEQDTLVCKVKVTLGSITANKGSRNDGIPAEIIQISKDSAALNMPANLENSTVATGLEEMSSFQSQREALPKNVQTTA